VAAAQRRGRLGFVKNLQIHAETRIKPHFLGHASRDGHHLAGHRPRNCDPRCTGTRRLRHRRRSAGPQASARRLCRIGPRLPVAGGPRRRHVRLRNPSGPLPRESRPRRGRTATRRSPTRAYRFGCTAVPLELDGGLASFGPGRSGRRRHTQGTFASRARRPARDHPCVTNHACAGSCAPAARPGPREPRSAGARMDPSRRDCPSGSDQEGAAPAAAAVSGPESRTGDHADDAGHTPAGAGEEDPSGSGLAR
jgi:hypothetical protein